MAPCIDSLPPLAFTNQRPIPTMLHPPSPFAIRAQDAQRFIVFSYFVPETCQSAECPVATEATADVSTGIREDLWTDIHLSSMLHRYLPHFFDEDSMQPHQAVEGTTEVSVAPVAISNVEEEDRFYHYSLPPLAQRFIGNSFNFLETSKPAVSATECPVATETTATTATVKGENRWAARSLPSVLPTCLPTVFDDDFMPSEQTVEDTYEVSVATETTAGTATVDFGVYRSAAKCPVPMLPPSLPLVFEVDYKLPGEAVEDTTKCPVISETNNDVSTHLKEDMAADQSPPDPAALPPSSPCIRDSDHKLTEETKEDATESSVTTAITAGTSIVQGENLLGDKSPAPMLPSKLPHILDNGHKQPEEAVEDTTKSQVSREAAVSVSTVHTLPGEAVEDTNKCPVAREAAVSVSTVHTEECLAEKSPPAPATLPLILTCTHNNDHKPLWKTVECTTKCSVDTEATVAIYTWDDKSPPGLQCIHNNNDHKQPEETVEDTT